MARFLEILAFDGDASLMLPSRSVLAAAAVAATALFACGGAEESGPPRTPAGAPPGAGYVGDAPAAGSSGFPYVDPRGYDPSRGGAVYVIPAGGGSGRATNDGSAPAERAPRSASTFASPAPGYSCPSHVPPRPDAPRTSPVPAGFLSVPPPSAGTLSCANLSRREWKVGVREGGVAIEAYNKASESDPLPFSTPGKAKEGFVGARHVAGVDDGYLVGFDGGDSGGALYWFSKDGRQRSRIADENITGLVKLGPGVVALTGDARGGQSRGRALRMVKTTSWQAGGSLELGAAVQAAARESDESLVAITTSGVFRMTACGDVFSIAKSTYDVLYPNSAAIDASGVITIGMRQYVVQLLPGPDGYSARWLAPQGCSVVEKRHFECVCLQ